MPNIYQRAFVGSSAIYHLASFWVWQRERLDIPLSLYFVVSLGFRIQRNVDLSPFWFPLLSPIIKINDQHPLTLTMFFPVRLPNLNFFHRRNPGSLKSQMILGQCHFGPAYVMIFNIEQFYHVTPNLSFPFRILFVEPPQCMLAFLII